MKNYQKALKHTVNILAAVLFGAVAFVFIAYGLAYKSLPFIDRHFMLLLSLSRPRFVPQGIAPEGRDSNPQSPIFLCR